MTPRTTWLSFSAVSAIILLAAGWLGATVWRQDEREQRAGALALWEQKVQAALWRMDAAASAMVAREANRRPEEIAALARKTDTSGNAGLQARSEGLTRRDESGLASPRSQGGHLAAAAPVIAAAKRAPALADAATPAALTAPAAPAPAQVQPRATVEENKNRYFSGQVAAKKADAPAAKEKGGSGALRGSPLRTEDSYGLAPVGDVADQESSPNLKPAGQSTGHGRLKPTLPQADANESLTAELADKLPAPAAEVAPAKAQALYQEPAAGRIEAQVEAQVANSYNLRQAAKESINSNFQRETDSMAKDGKPFGPTGALTPLAENGDIILARRVETRGGEIVQGVRLDTAAVAEELLALVRGDFPKGQLLPEPANPPQNLARTLAALPLRFEPNDFPVLSTGWTPTRFAVAGAGAALMVALGAVALLLARTLALSERRATFVSTMTHELRTPLTTFRLYTDLLEAAPEIADRTRYTKVLAREAERLSHLVENVLSYARLERGRSKPAPKAQTVDELLSPALDRLRERAERAGFALEVAPHDGAQRVRADAATVEQILLNLVDNAGKYALAAADKRLVLSVAEGEISLRDFGPGLDPVMRKRLFTPFSRSDKEAAGNAPGVGLGLALCRRLVREMGGDLVYRKAEPGAEFVLVL